MQATHFYLFNRSFCHQKIKLKNSFNRAMPRMTKMQISTFEAKNLADKKLGLLLHFQKMMSLFWRQRRPAVASATTSTSSTTTTDQKAKRTQPHPHPSPTPLASPPLPLRELLCESSLFVFSYLYRVQRDQILTLAEREKERESVCYSIRIDHCTYLCVCEREKESCVRERKIVLCERERELCEREKESCVRERRSNRRERGPMCESETLM